MLGPRAIAWWALRTMTDGVTVEGLDRVPRTGPVLLAARHYHHLLDGAVLVHHLARPVHIVVGLDWTAHARQRRWMERACAWAEYPVILRSQTTGAQGGYAASEVRTYVRSGVRHAAALLRDGRVVLVFPEGYPVVDPTASDATPRARDAGGLLPFAAGFRTIADAARRRVAAADAGRAGAADVAIVPVGFRYEPRGARWRIAARFGAPLAAGADVATVANAVRELSR